MSVPAEVLFVAADEPLLVFPTVLDAELYLEAIDVENGVYPIAYGRNGEPYSIRSDGMIVVIDRMPEPARPGELALLLRKYLAAIGRSPDPERTLVELAEEVWLCKCAS